MEDSNTLKKLLNDAIVYATAKFRGIEDKEGRPYVLHCLGAMNNVRAADHTDYEGMIAAVLHDLVEDTDVTVNDIALRFGDRAARAVHALTHKDGEPYEEYLVRVLTDPVAVRAKIGDIKDNLGRPGASDSLKKRYTKALALLETKDEEYKLYENGGNW